MDIDLLFAVTTPKEWRSISGDGVFKNTSMKGEDTLLCFEGKQAEDILNHYYKDQPETLLLVVLDPLRIQSPIKRIKENNFELIEIKEPVSLDAVIDKIKLHPDKDGQFSINVKHFD